MFFRKKAETKTKSKAPHFPVASRPATPSPKRFGWVRRGVKYGAILFLVFALYQAVTWPSIRRLATENPPSTALIDARVAEAQSQGKPVKREQVWVGYRQISANLKRAVLAGEDTRFFGHDGFDREAIEKAMLENWEKKRFARGASTISQQLIKNLYLSESKNPFRKLKEAALTWEMEKMLSKDRILEIYLNVIEWGDGIYGAEAASRHYFNKSAANLSADDAAFLAAMIPNPRTVYNPQRNLKRVNRRKRLIQRYMNAIRLPK